MKSAPVLENDGTFAEVDTTTHIDRINHMAMETHAAVAEFDSQGELTIYSPNQTVYGIRSFIADLVRYGLQQGPVSQRPPWAAASAASRSGGVAGAAGLPLLPCG